jgi:hypothetical protein
MTLGVGGVFFYFLGRKGRDIPYSAADVVWVVVQGFGWGLFGRKKRWGGPVEMHARSPVPMEAIHGLTLGVGGAFVFFGTQRQGHILLQTSHGRWCRGLDGVCLVGKKGGGDL